MSPKLIVAFDFDNQNQALSLADQLDPTICAIKIGSEMFTHFGAPIVKQIVDRKFKVFLDLKFHDIPNTVAKACKAAADLGVWMTNVHASGGEKMMSAARDALDVYGNERPILIAVTVLTCFNQMELHSVGVKISLSEQVNHLAALAQNSGLDGVVCSPHEAKAIKELCGVSFLTVTPGVRLKQDSVDDQQRIMSPGEAVREGSDYLVIGRPITHAENPVEKVKIILSDMLGEV